MACRRLAWGCRTGPAPSSSWRRSALTSAENPHPDAPIKSGAGSPPQAGEGQQQAFGVYVHWPFCLSKCPYCDFNSHVRHAPIDEERFSRAFAREIETTAARAPGRVVSSIFLGGGTPSLMRPQTVGSILDAIARHWRVAHAYSATGGITFTFGGLKVDENAQVIGTDWRPIKGLYCCGEMVGGLFYDNYSGGHGSRLGRNLRTDCRP